MAAHSLEFLEDSLLESRDRFVVRKETEWILRIDRYLVLALIVEFGIGFGIGFVMHWHCRYPIQKHDRFNYLTTFGPSSTICL